MAVFWRRDLFTVMTGLDTFYPGSGLAPFTHYPSESSHPPWQCCEANLTEEGPKAQGGSRGW